MENYYKSISIQDHDDYILKSKEINYLSLKYGPSFGVGINKVNEKLIMVTISRNAIGTVESINEFIKELENHFD